MIHPPVPPRPARVLAAPLLALALASCGGGSGGEGAGPTVVEDPVGATSSAPDAGACGEVTLARMNWASAETHAEIDRLFLEAGLGCEVRLVDGDTLPTFESMRASGVPDVAPELWTAGVAEDLDAAVAEGSVALGARTIAEGGLEGWWIPGDLAAAHPEIRTVGDALARPDLFPAPGDASLGAIHTCPSGWNCAVINENLFRAHGAASAGFTLVRPDSAAALDTALDGAVAAGEGWLGYYWSPTARTGRHGLVRLEGPPHDPVEWERCTTVPDCTEPRPIDYAPSEVRVLMTAGFAERERAAADYLSRRELDNATVNAVLEWIDDEGASPAEAARHFVDEHEAVWTAWVDEAVAARVRAAP